MLNVQEVEMKPELNCMGHGDKLVWWESKSCQKLTDN